MDIKELKAIIEAMLFSTGREVTQKELMGILELNKEQLRYIMEHKPLGMETEIFIHGAICFSYSGRCFLSDFMTGRSANLGDCAQSCRWAYNLYLEEKDTDNLRNNPIKI